MMNYFVPANAGSFSVGKRQAWMQSYDAYTLHAARRRKFPRRKIFVVGIDHLWQLDLADMSSLSNYNDGVRYLLCCVDVFSRYAFVRALKNKSALTIRDAFDDILECRVPAHVQTDKGREFLNAVFQEYLRTHNINFYTSQNDDIKCSIAERFIRTLKAKLARMMTYYKDYRYVDKLQDIVLSYNATKHSALDMAPNNVNLQNEQRLFERLYKAARKRSSSLYKIGDTVRIARKTQAFEKAHYPKWTEEIFIIAAIYNTNPITYGLKDYAGEIIQGKFYTEELQKVTGKDPRVFKVEKVLKTRKRGGKTQFLVRWSGYSPKHDSWVDEVLY